MTVDDMAERFARDTAKHQMTVLHDDGLYRHLRFMPPAPASSCYWFDLITWPGSLVMRGDVGTDYVFTRLPDMFELFRGKSVNPHYWAEKLGGGRASVKEYSEDRLRQRVVDQFVEDARHNGGVPAGTGKRLRDWVLAEDLSDEHQARRVLEDFAFQGYAFSDLWERDFRDYGWEFLWACHGIVWGIAQYDAAPKTTSVRFDPPAPELPRRPESRDAFADALRARPGEWALIGAHPVAGSAGQAAYEISRALGLRNAPFAPAGTFEAQSRAVCGEHRIYVRYVGGVAGGVR